MACLVGDVRHVRAALGRRDRVDKRELLEAVVRRRDGDLPPLGDLLEGARRARHLRAEEEVDVVREVVGRQPLAVEVDLDGVVQPSVSFSLIVGLPTFIMLSLNTCLKTLPSAASAVSTINSDEKMLASLAP